MSVLKRILFTCTPDKLLFQIKKWHYLRKLKCATEEDEEDLYLVKNLLHEGDQVLDIGANFGVYTRFLSIYTGITGKVYSFEPIPETFQILQNNIQKLNLTNVISLNYAISDSSGKVIMEVPRYEKAGDNFYEAKIVNTSAKNLKSFKVECKTLDELFSIYHFHPIFIKCDVEGFEWNVFKEAKELLKKTEPALFIEINQDLTSSDEKTTRLLDFLTTLNYKIFIKYGDILKAWENEKKVNYYFLLQKHIDDLGEKGLLNK